MTTYNVEIVINGRDRASGPLGSAGGALSRISQIAGGILSAQLFTRMADGIMDMGRQALDSYANYERLGMSLESLVARELLNSGAAGKMNDALSKASPIAKELLGWIQKLGIDSPFTDKDVADSFRLALAYGFTTKEAQRLTQATMDFAAGSGANGDSMNRIALALGQIRARGKLAGQEIMQLTEAGIPVREILAKGLSVTTAELEKMVSDGLVPADQAVQIITESLEKDFGGAAKRQATTFSGLITSLSAIKDIGLREFFTGTFQAIQPYLSGFVDKLSDPTTMNSLREMGMGLGGFLSSLMAGGQNAIKIFGGWQGAFDSLSKTQAFDNMSKGLGLFSRFWTNNGPGISRTMRELGGNLQRSLGPLAVKILQFATEQFRKFSAWFVENGPLIQRFLKTLADRWGFVAEAVGGAWQFIEPLLTALGDLLMGFGKMYMQIFVGDWEGAWETMWSTLRRVDAGIQQAIWAFFNWIANQMGSSLGNIKRQWASNWEQFKQIVSTVRTNVQNTISEMLASIRGQILGAVDGIRSAGSDLITGLWRGIQARWAQLISDLMHLVSLLPQVIQDMFGLNGGAGANNLPNMVFANQASGGGFGSSSRGAGSTYHSSRETNQIFGVVNVYVKDNNTARKLLRDMR